MLPIRLFHSILILTLLFISSLLRAQEAEGEAVIPQPHLALTNANVFDVRSGDVRSNATVVLRDGKIVSVGSDAVPPDTEVIDLGGRYLLPGWIDAHTHMASLSQARRALESGVTTVKTAGVEGFRDVALREMAQAGYIGGPDVVAAGIFVLRNLEDRVLSDPKLAELHGGVNTPDQLRHLVRVNMAHGVDGIKTAATEAAGRPTSDPRKQVYTEAQLRVIVEEAATQGLPVECHAHGDGGSWAAIQAGVHSIAHGTYMFDATLKLMKQKGTFLVPTYSVVLDLAEPGGEYDDPVLRIRGAHMATRLESTIRRAHAMGVKLATGTDTYYGPNSLIRISNEVINFVKLGLSPLEAIQSATLVGAELLRLEKSTGAVEPGLEADLIAIEGNPLEDIRLVQDVLLVISNGRVAMNRLPIAAK